MGVTDMVFPHTWRTTWPENAEQFRRLTCFSWQADVRNHDSVKYPVADLCYDAGRKGVMFRRC